MQSAQITAKVSAMEHANIHYDKSTFSFSINGLNASIIDDMSKSSQNSMNNSSSALGEKGAIGFVEFSI
jgi:hypothetical protein